MIAAIEKNRHLIVFAFFSCFLLIGFMIFKDYGAHYDEQNNETYGERWTNYTVSPAFHTPNLMDLTHGPFLEISLTLLRNYLHLTDIRQIILLRHLSIFLLFFLGTIIFYFLCLGHFRNWKLALLGSAFLILSPRQFNHAFYNTMDIGFLVFFLLAVFTLLRFLNNKTPGMAILSALTCAMAADIRTIGILLVFLTGLSLRNEHSPKNIKLFFIYLALFFVFFILFCPLLWSHPYAHVLLIFKNTAIKNIALPYQVFYLGKKYHLYNLPWHYVPVWILISTPIMYIFLFLIGCLSSTKALFVNHLGNSETKKNTIIFLLWFFVPLLFTQGKIYDSWRQLFFIYPALVLLAVSGFKYLWESLVFARLVLALLLLAGIISVAEFMIRNHPFEDVYFNSLAGKSPDEIKANFELNDWGNSDKQALEYILKTDKSSSIKVKFNIIDPGHINFYFLPKADRKRLVFADTKTTPKYFIVQYRYPQDWPYKEEIYSIKVEGLKILSIYQL